MIQCHQIFKQFSGRPVLSSVSFEIPEGSVFGLLGPSGAGKTTLIKILTGQLDFDKGSVSILGKDVRCLTGEDHKQFGIMMDQFGLYERLSCLDNLKIFADIYGVPYGKIKETLQLVGLHDAAGKSASNLSKGMRARLQLARVFMHSPKILFLDEPTSGLDPQTMRSIHRMILDRKERGATIFLTTHNMEEAATLCDTVALLNEGVIVDAGAPKELCLKYDHQKSIRLHLTNGKDLEIAQNAEAADTLRYFMKEGKIETIHSSEPTLETVFLELTGRSLEEA
ncbi:MAG: ABC transporter ATP-binding protein [Lachnospiraceae bacterium]|nr:ABC transporter ATP-binding protein [Lachnospiraceae bacterium]